MAGGVGRATDGVQVKKNSAAGHCFSKAFRFGPNILRNIEEHGTVGAQIGRPPPSTPDFGFGFNL